MMLVVRLFALALSLAVLPVLAAGKIEMQWFGQSCWKITTPEGKVIVTDPWILQNPTTPAELKNLDALGKVDLILVTHAHFDHFADAPALAKKNNAKIVGPQGLHSTMGTYGIVPAELTVRMGKGGTYSPFPGVKITATHAEHDSELVWPDAHGNKQVYVGGEPFGYIIDIDGFKIYHMGDTGLFGDMKFIGEYYKPDIVLIPIGGHFVMNPEDAAFATKTWLKPKYAVPMHYASNPFLKGTPAEYVKAMGDAPTKVFPIKQGEKLTF
ncbi:MAG TPA: metal-dependent hydrolase [Usitatibacter sp.]|nr:metal-dependent hydrolase [Usitatibacter sp.]